MAAAPWKPGVALLVCASLAGCGVAVPLASRHESRMSQLEVGLSRKEVRERIGEPNTARAAATTKDGAAIQVDEYRLHRPYEALVNVGVGFFTMTVTWWIPLPLGNVFLLQYRNGKLEKWGREQDIKLVNLATQ